MREIISNSWYKSNENDRPKNTEYSINKIWILYIRTINEKVSHGWTIAKTRYNSMMRKYVHPAIDSCTFIFPNEKDHS